MTIITAFDIQYILTQWAEGLLSESQVHYWAEDRYCVSGFECESDAVIEVLSRLDMMDMNLVIPNDIPVLISALFSPDFESILATYERQIDYSERKESLRSFPLYSQFCGYGKMP